MRSKLSDADLKWTSMSSVERDLYRHVRWGIFNSSLSSHEVLSMWPQMAAASGTHWDGPKTASRDFFAPLSQGHFDRWRDRCRRLLVDLEEPWASNNLFGLAVVTRAIAEHVGLGTMHVPETYVSSHSVTNSAWVQGPSGANEPLKWARQRIEATLARVAEDEYDGLTILAGFAHPSRFGMQAYLDGSLDRSRIVTISSCTDPQMPALVAVILMRLMSLIPLITNREAP